MDHVNVAKNVRGKDQQKRTTGSWSKERREHDERVQQEKREKERKDLEEVENKQKKLHSNYKLCMVCSL